MEKIFKSKRFLKTVNQKKGEMRGAGVAQQ